MFTRQELIDIGERAMAAAHTEGLKSNWKNACVNLAAAAEHLADMIERVWKKAITDNGK